MIDGHDGGDGQYDVRGDDDGGGSYRIISVCSNSSSLRDIHNNYKELFF